MTDAIQMYDAGAIMEQVIIKGDLSKLAPAERAEYYNALCQSLGLNPLTQPFEYITLNGKLTLYARKSCTDQLRTLRGVSFDKPAIDYADDLVIVTISARDATGRTDSDIGAVVIGHLKGEAKANALMKAITKAKRRTTLSLCGLGTLDETEVETIPGAQPFVEAVSSEVVVQTVTTTAPNLAVEPITADQRKQLHKLGKELYGEEWDTQRHRLIKWATKNRTESSKDLRFTEATSLIQGFEVKLLEKKAKEEEEVYEIPELPGVEYAAETAKCKECGVSPATIGDLCATCDERLTIAAELKDKKEAKQKKVA